MHDTAGADRTVCPVPLVSVAGTGRPRIIALIGIDGSGKTTQARLLAGWLIANQVRATYSQNAGGRRWFGRLARLFGRPDAQALLGRRLMLAVEGALRWLAIARGLLRARLTGSVAVMDRYAVCQLASIRAHGGRVGRLTRLAFRMFPTPDVTFLLVVPPDEACRRIEARGTDHERYEFLAAGAAAYRELPQAAGFVLIDADTTPERVHESLRAHLHPLFNVVAGQRVG